jgi:AmmeMemoRadiSam system protein A/AmmeMemoRadiSam system protein B
MSIVSSFIVPHPPLIIPEIGKGEEQEISKTTNAYERIAKEIAVISPQTIIILTPHSTLYADYFHISSGENTFGNFASFGQPSVKINAKYDNSFVQILSEISENNHIPAGTLGERYKMLDHATMIPLYFINKYYQNYKIVRISISGLSALMHYQFGKCIQKAAKVSNKKIVFIASGDLSHKLKANGPYGLSEEGPIFDQKITNDMVNGNFLNFMTYPEDFCNAAAECGLKSFIVMAGALNKKSVKSELFSYECPFGVGYAVASFTVVGEDKNRNFDEILQSQESNRITVLRNNENMYVHLARLSLEKYVRENEILVLPNDIPDEMLKNRAGVFVSLKKNKQLRGCIGTIAPTTENIAKEIINNAISAGTQDPRFDSIGLDELDELEYSVDILGIPEPVVSINELDVKRYGVIVSHRERKGLLLPNLEGISSPQEQINVALQKAGISKHEPYTTQRFEVVRYK